MKETYSEYWPQFFTATIGKWQQLLSRDKHKEVIIDSMEYLVKEKRIVLNAFVIMSNHIHLIRQPMFGFTPSGIQASFMKYTAQQLKRSLEKNDHESLAGFKVNNHDRDYQVWKRDSLGIELRTAAVFEQKMNYIHYNPVKAGLCSNPEDYHYSSASYYITGTDSFKILTYYSGN